MELQNSELLSAFKSRLNSLISINDDVEREPNLSNQKVLLSTFERANELWKEIESRQNAIKLVIGKIPD